MYLIPQDWLDYINEHLLLKNEELNLSDVKAYNGMFDIPVIKRTARTRRTVALLTIGLESDVVAERDLLQLFTTPRAKKQLDMTDETYEWICNGLVIREFRFEKDGLTVKRKNFRMGLHLYRQKLQLEEEQKRKQAESFLQWTKEWDEIKTTSNSQNPQRQNALHSLKNWLDDMARTKEFLSIHPNWQFNKKLLFLHFLTAFYHISMAEPHFDWKEIGARYYRKIGGSKAFDSYKKEFIEIAEEVLDIPLHILGLSSLGTITSLYFVGQMEGETVTYDYGPIHATTDLAVFNEIFKTKAKVLWLVENRGILTRMAFETEFLTTTNSFVLGIDGQLRSSHRRLIKQLLRHVEQVIIWTDVDEAGFIIGSHLAELLQGYDVTAKWVVPPLEVVSSLEAFKKAYEQALEVRSAEQEEQIGGIERWKKWISL